MARTKLKDLSVLVEIDDQEQKSIVGGRFSVGLKTNVDTSGFTGPLSSAEMNQLISK